MKQLLLFGAGKSATVLIDYLLSHAQNENWKLVVADANLQLAKSKIKDRPNGEAISFDIADEQLRETYIRQADIVISMLPPTLHFLVARDCLQHSKHLLTASYVDDQMRSIQTEIEDRQILFLCEMGLDPGIDHMSAMKIIDEITDRGGKITSFKSHCGGLVAPESDDNPWHYKISWNPRNIILAGKAGAHYRLNNEEVKLQYEQLFQPDRNVNVPDAGPLSWYPNRDSLSYESLYGLTDTKTFLRTTLRHPDFIGGWQYIIQLMLTDETPFYQTDDKSFAKIFKEHVLRFGLQDLVAQLQADPDSILSEQINFLDLIDNSSLINKGLCSAADILQMVVEKKLSLQPADKDMIVMLHEFDYELEGREFSIKSSLVVKGDDNFHTAMAKTVGLPLGIAARLLLNGTIKTRGLQIPTSREIYLPVLKELESYSIKFHEQ